MEILLIILIVLVIIAIFTMFMVFSRKSKPIEKDDTGFKLILEQINELNRTVDKKMGESNKDMSTALHRQFSESQKLIRDITEEVTQVKEIGKQSLSITEQLRELQDILKNPKQRGILGEYYLETLLKNILAPNQYKMQYAFTNGEIVDAVVFVKDKIIPIDSKFSLENYNKLVEEKNPIEKEKLEKSFVNDLKRNSKIYKT